MAIFCPNSGISPTLQTKTVTPSSSTQYVTPSSRYDGLSQVTVNGDSNLVAGNIVSGKSIFGVSGGYQPQLTEQEVKYSNITNRKIAMESNAYYFSVILGQTDSDGNTIDYSKMVYMSSYFYIRTVPPMASTNYQLETHFNAKVRSINNSIVYFDLSGNEVYVKERTRYSIVRYTSGYFPTSQFNISTKELKLALTMNPGDGKLDSYITTGSVSSYFSAGVYIYIIV